MIRQLVLLVLLGFSSSLAQLMNFDVVSEWKVLDFVWNSQDQRQAAINSGEYVPGNNVPLDVALHYSRIDAPSPSRCSIRNIRNCFPRRAGNAVQSRDITRVFVTVPRFSTGIPATLNTISDAQGSGGPLLRPYPNWPMNQDQSCQGIISVFRVAVSIRLFSNY